MSFVNFNNREELSSRKYTKTVVLAALLEAETKNIVKAKNMIANLAEEVELNEALSLFSDKIGAMRTLDYVATLYQPILEGQFSWLTHDTAEQIGSERENTIDVWMFDNQGNMWYEKNYAGYGEFGGMDYYEVVAKMNGYSDEDLDIKVGKKNKIYRELREIGIALAFGELETKDKKGKVLFPALMADPKGFNYKRWDFSEEAPHDPNQSWYVEPEYDEEEWESEYESKNEALDFNDPVLMAFRAAKAERDARLAAAASAPKKAKLYGKKRSEAEDKLWTISQELKDLYSDRNQLLRDMEAEAGQLGMEEFEKSGKHDQYGGELNTIEDKIQDLLAKRGQLEMRLAESVNSSDWGTLRVGEAWIGPFQFTDKMSDDELKKVYDEAVNGYAYWQKGFEHPKSDYKKAYQEIAKILKKRGVVVESFDAINESDWGTFDTPEGKMVAKELDKAWNTFAKTVDAAHNEWLKVVQKYRGDAGNNSGFSDSEGREAVMSAIEWYLEKVFKVDNKFGGLDYKKYRTLMGESIEVNEARAVKGFDKKLIDHKTQPHQEGGLKMIYKGATQNVDAEVYDKWIELKGLDKLPEDWRGQHHGIFFELKKNLYLWATDMLDAKTGRPARRDSSGEGYFNVMAIFTMDGDEILTLWERPSSLPLAKHGGPGVGYQYESVVTENYEVIYSDGVSAMKKFRTEQQALDFMKQTIASNKKLRDIAVYKPGMHSTTQTELVVAFWGNGSYLDNVSKKDDALAAKKIEEAVVNEMKKPKTWDTQFAMKAIDAYEAGEFDPEDDKAVADWEKEYNGGKKPNPSFDTYNIIAYALMTGKKPDGTPIEEGNAFGAARAEAIAKGEKTFKVGSEEYDVENVDKEDKENAKEFVGEGRSINKIQKEWAEVTSMMKSTVEEWKKAEGDTKGSLLDKLKSLTARKNELEKELDSAVQLKDVDAELVEAKKPSWDALIEEFKMTNEDLRTDLKKYIKANEKELNELADNDNWDAIYDMLRNDFNVKEGSKQDEDLISTFNFIF